MSPETSEPTDAPAAAAPVALQPAAHHPLWLVLSSPSGAGKSTLANALLQADPNFRMSVSATTRPPRPAERDGVHYHFLDKPTFERRLDEDAFIEWARVFDNYYGTPRDPVTAWRAEGRDVLFDVDWQGAQKIAAAGGDSVVRVFILPPSIKELERRLRARAADDQAVIDRRMARAAAEIAHWEEYDYVLVNNVLHDTLADIKAIVAAERLRRHRQGWLAGFVAGLNDAAEG